MWHTVGAEVIDGGEDAARVASACARQYPPHEPLLHLRCQTRCNRRLWSGWLKGPEAVAGRPVGRSLPWERRASQSCQARPEEARGPSSGTAKGRFAHMLLHVIAETQRAVLRPARRLWLGRRDRDAASAAASAGASAAAAANAAAGTVAGANDLFLEDLGERLGLGAVQSKGLRRVSSKTCLGSASLGSCLGSASLGSCLGSASLGSCLGSASLGLEPGTSYLGWHSGAVEPAHVRAMRPLRSGRLP